jgi:hypothetical protein
MMTTLIPAAIPALTLADVLMPRRFSSVKTVAKIIFQPHTAIPGANSCACCAHQIVQISGLSM